MKKPSTEADEVLDRINKGEERIYSDAEARQLIGLEGTNDWLSHMGGPLPKEFANALKKRPNLRRTKND